MKGKLVLYGAAALVVWWFFLRGKSASTTGCPAGAGPCDFDPTWCCNQDKNGNYTDALPYIDGKGFS